MRRIAAITLAAGIALFPAASASANPDEPDIKAWIQEHEQTLEFFLNINVEECKGLDGITYSDAVRLGKANDIDLPELAKRTDPDEIMDYVLNSGVTMADVEAFLNAFCAGDVKPPPAVPAPLTPEESEQADNPGGGDPSAAPECKPDKELADLVGRLESAPENSAGYDRDAFRYDARDAVLEQEKRADGTWLSVWDGKVYSDSSDMEVDHTVALAEAWESGARDWTDAERKAFANDTDNPYVLNAITAGLNSSKGSNDPAEWMPDVNRGEYVKQWATVKLAYGLTADSAELAALKDAAAAQCAGSDAGRDDESPSGDAESPSGGSLAETGAGDLMLPLGVGLAAIGGGTGLLAIRRWRRSL